MLAELRLRRQRPAVRELERRELSQDVHDHQRLGTNGRITADRQECRIFLREKHEALPDTEKGWTVRYTTDLTEEVWYYLRGEEYSAQIDYWAQSIKAKRMDGESCFRRALDTDRVVAMITGEAQVIQAPVAPATNTGLFGRILGRSGK